MLPVFKVEKRLDKWAIYQKVDVNTWRYINSHDSPQAAQAIINSVLSSIIGTPRPIQRYFRNEDMNPLQRYYR